jgi:hypothetical protein
MNVCILYALKWGDIDYSKIKLVVYSLTPYGYLMGYYPI